MQGNYLGALTGRESLGIAYKEERKGSQKKKRSSEEGKGEKVLEIKRETQTYSKCLARKGRKKTA